MPLEIMIPPKLKDGDEVRVIAPARSLAIVSQSVQKIATGRLEKLGLRVSFGKNVEALDEFNSSSMHARLEDLHAAFADSSVKAVLTAIGGFNSNQLLGQIDYDLIRKNPKVLCGYSDITALQNAFLKMTGLVTYSGPHYSTFGMEQGIDYTFEGFKRCLFSREPFQVHASKEWSDDPWYLDQNARQFHSNPGMVVVQTGKARGRIIGGNLCTFNLLQGTRFMPSLEGVVLFLEDDEQAGALSNVEFDRNLQSVLHLDGFNGVRGIIIGRFQKKSVLPVEKLKNILLSKKELSGIPIIANVDFGHTTPHMTFPVGGTVAVEASESNVRLTIEQH